MILRAAFFIALVALIIPHEPDLGFGRPGTISLPSNVTGWIQSAATVGDGCKDRNDTCGHGIKTLDQLQALALRSLAEVKAEIEADQRSRKTHAG
jgi:hypothetical protein